MRKRKITQKGKRFREILTPTNNHLRMSGLPMRRYFLNKHFIIFRKTK